MSVPCVARQPIFDRFLRVVGYELLFRDVAVDTEEAHVVHGDEATAKVISDTLMELGLEHVIGSGLGFINVTRPFVVGELPLVLPPDHVVLELLEDVQVDRQLVAAVAQLKSQGFRVALDDFHYEESARPLLELADVVKIEVLDRTREELDRELDLLDPFEVRVLAEKVETHETYELCHELGFHYFQGFFFERPRLVGGHPIQPGVVAKVRLAGELQQPGLDLEALERIVSQDVALSYRLVRTVNSAFFSLPRRISSLHDALVLLGENQVRRWATVIVLAGLEGKPDELIGTALVRARMCELIAEQSGARKDQGYFLTGLFSLLDALVDAPLEEVIDDLPLSDEIVDALVSGRGTQGEILRSVVAYEHGDFAGAELSSVPTEQIAEAYLGAVGWARDAVQGMT
jgi:EAL and modified HD-GYP domain-containing signal transduction protein